jgi:hypothetical protein
MAKRMTDTDKWKKPFIRGLEGAYKILWLYILDECDHAGIWHVDFEVAQIRTGEKLDLETALKNFGDRVISFDNDTKFFIPGFIEFQYGELNPENRVHLSVITILARYGIDGNKGLVSPLRRAKDKDKDKEKAKDKDPSAEKEKRHTLDIFLDDCANIRKMKTQPTADQLEKLKTDFGEESVKAIFLQMENYKKLTTNNISVYLTANNWLSNRSDNGSGKKTSGMDKKTGGSSRDAYTRSDGGNGGLGTLHA